MRLTSKGNRSRHAKAGADGVDGWEDERAGGKFWTGLEGSAALGRSRDGRVRMRVEKKKPKVCWRRELGWLGWTPKERPPSLACGRARGPSVLWGSRLEQWYGTAVPRVPGYMQLRKNRAGRPDPVCQPDTAGHQLGERTCHAPRSLSLRWISLR